MNRPTLKSVSTVITKGTTPTSVGGKFTESGIIFIKSESITGSKHPAPEFYTYIDEATDQKLKRSRLREGDLLVSIAGAYLGKLAIVTKRDVPSNTNQAVGIVRLDPQKACVDYIYYFFSQPHLNAHINKLSSQSSQPNLNLELLGNLEFDPRSIAEQKRIASVLSSFDAKIELNNRINAELEGIAKLLYDYWFVQFDFPMTAAQAAALGKPQLAGKPYRSSGGKMIYNEVLKREIPEGWKGCKLEDVLTLQYGKALKKDTQVPGDYPVYGSGGIYGSHNVPLVQGPGIIVGRKGSVGELYWSNISFYPTDTSYYVEPKAGMDLNYAYFLLQRLPLKSMNSDSAVPGLSRIAAYQLPATLPDKPLIAEFGKTAAPLRAAIANNEKQNQELTQLRDWLLPMLMNGQVTVN